MHGAWSAYRAQCLQQHAFKAWLLDQGSLTDRLIQYHASFSVQLLRQSPLMVNADEWARLQLSHRQKALVRDVFLCQHNIPVVFAHSVVALSAQHVWRFVRHLGTRSLGSRLFSNPKIHRGLMEFTKLSSDHVLRQQLHKDLIAYPDILLMCQKASFLMARRSVFYQHAIQKPLLVTEVFLPNLLYKGFL